MAQRSTQRTDILSAARCSDILPESYLRNLSNLPVHRNIAQIGQDAPNRGLAYSTKFRCTCQDKFHFFLEKFFSSLFSRQLWRIWRKNAAYCPLPADIFRGKGVDGHGNGLALDGNGGSLAHFRRADGKLECAQRCRARGRAERGRAVFGDVRRDVPLDGRDGSDEPVSSHRPPRFPLPPAAQEAPAEREPRQRDAGRDLRQPLCRPFGARQRGHTARHPRCLPHEPRLQGYRIG